MPSLPEHTRRRANVLRLACLGAMAMVALSWLWAAFHLDAQIADRAASLGLDPLGWSLSPAARAGLVAAALPGSVAALFTLWQASRLFGAYARDAALTAEAAEAIRGIGAGMLALAAIGVIRRTADTLLLTSGAPEGQRMLAIGLGSQDLAFLLAAGLMLLIGVVMAQAVDVARENAGFV